MDYVSLATFFAVVASVLIAAYVGVRVNSKQAAAAKSQYEYLKREAAARGKGFAAAGE